MNLVEQLNRDEGRKRFAYQDHLGFWTIGAGILIDERKGGGLDDEEIDWLLARRAEKARAALAKRLPWFSQLDQVRQDGLVNMAYQLGVDGVLGFPRMLAALRDQRWHEAAHQALDSLWAKQTPERARRIAHQFATGEMQ